MEYLKNGWHGQAKKGESQGVLHALLTSKDNILTHPEVQKTFYDQY